MGTAHLVQTGLGLLPNVWTFGSETPMIGLACSARGARQSASLPSSCFNRIRLSTYRLDQVLHKVYWGGSELQRRDFFAKFGAGFREKFFRSNWLTEFISTSFNYGWAWRHNWRISGVSGNRYQWCSIDLLASLHSTREMTRHILTPPCQHFWWPKSNKKFINETVNLCSNKYGAMGLARWTGQNL